MSIFPILEYVPGITAGIHQALHTYLWSELVNESFNLSKRFLGGHRNGT